MAKTEKIPERVVHAYGGLSTTVALVRYDKRGQWFVEWADGHRVRIPTVDLAVENAQSMWHGHAGGVNWDQPGGTVFNRKLRAAEAERDKRIADQKALEVANAITILTEFLSQASRPEKCGVRRAIEVLTHGPS